MTTTEFDYQRKIRALLDKAEGTDNANEAEAFSRKAEELMLRWGVEAAELAHGKPATEEIVIGRILYTGWMAPAHVTAAYQVVDGLGLRGVSRSFGRGGTQLEIIGFESDVERAKMLITSLDLQWVAAHRAWWRTASERRWMDRKAADKAKRQFMVSFFSAVKRRLVAKRTTIVEQAGTGTELAIRDRASLVNDWMDDAYGTLRTKKAGWQRSFYGANEGSAAGQRASLGDTEVGRRGGRNQLGS